MSITWLKAGVSDHDLLYSHAAIEDGNDTQDADEGLSWQPRNNVPVPQAIPRRGTSAGLQSCGAHISLQGALDQFTTAAARYMQAA